MPFEKQKNIKKNGKFYYWNSETKMINEISIKELEIKNCPQDVLCDLLSLLDDQNDKE
jgi:hypothetical protein